MQVQKHAMRQARLEQKEDYCRRMSNITSGGFFSSRIFLCCVFFGRLRVYLAVVLTTSGPEVYVVD